MKNWVKILLVLLALVLLWTLITGFVPVTSVFLEDFSVSEDGSLLTFTVGNASSMGYVRSFRDTGGGVKPHCLKFYSAWGGLNSSLGAKNQFTLQLDPTDTEICFDCGQNGTPLVLHKDPATGEWQR